MSPSELPKIHFDISDPNIDATVYMDFWESRRDWLLQKGYYLYNIHPELEYAFPSIPYSEIGPHPPYAYFHGYEHDASRYPRFSEIWVQRRVAYAQDSLGRHLAIKLVKKFSQEYRIIRFLQQEHEEARRCNLITVIDILHHDDHCFLIMPRWGRCPTLPWFRTIQQLLDFIHIALIAVEFLHRNSIVHRDMKTGHFAINHVPPDMFCHLASDDTRTTLRDQGLISYALFDFDLSIMFPSEAQHVDRRLPVQMSWEVCIETPYDTATGESDYDPFSFEMGTLGIIFCHVSQHCTEVIPMLAPFLDRLITQNLKQRFTAAQALAFYEHMVLSQVPDNVLNQAAPREQGDKSWDQYDRWDRLSEEFVKEWGSYRAPSLSYGVRFLRWVCMFEMGYKIVRSIRRILRIH